MKKYILTAEGKKEVRKLKVSTTHREAGLSRVTIDKTRRTGIFSEKTLKAYFEKNIFIFQEGIHYIEVKQNMVICSSCQNEIHDTQPHTCYNLTQIK